MDNAPIDRLTRLLNEALAAVAELRDTQTPEPEPAPDPAPEPAPETPADDVLMKAGIVNVNMDKVWKAGVRLGYTVCVQILNVMDNRERYVKGAVVRLADGIERTVRWQEITGGFLNIHLIGASIDPDKAGWPHTADLIADASDEAEPAPEPKPEPKPEPTPEPTPKPEPAPGGSIVGWNREEWFMGMNQAGGDFAGHKMPGKFDTDYTYPNYNHLKGARDKGFKFARLCFKRGRLQHSVRGPLNGTEVNRIRKFLDDAHSLGMAVKTDPHDYFTIEGREATAVELIDFHLKFLEAFGNHPALVMIGLQNEPKGTSGRWNKVAVELVREIRTVTDKLINVPGDSYQSVTRWMKENPLYPIDAPNLCYGGHLYMDHDASGTWNKGRTAHVAPDQGVKMLRGWVENFLKPNDCYGHIGETGVPWENESALIALDNLLEYAYSEPRILGVTYWADGPWWGVNKEGVPPVNAIRSNGKWHEPTLKVVQKYVAK